MKNKLRIGQHVRHHHTDDVGVVVPATSGRAIAVPTSAYEVRWSDGRLAWAYLANVELISERDYAISLAASALTLELDGGKS